MARKILLIAILLGFSLPSFGFQTRIDKGDLKRIQGTPFVQYPNIQCGYQLILPKLEQLSKLPSSGLRKEILETSDIELEIGDVLTFNVANFRTSGTDQISAELRHKTEKTYIFVEVPEWQSGRVSQANVDAFHNAFEVSTPSNSFDPSKGIREIEDTQLGIPPDKTGDGYVYILIHDIQDNYDPENNNLSYIAGYFNPNDQSDVPSSNKKDIIYVDSNPNNPSGQFALLAVAHEYQHLIHHRYDKNEETWLNEGSSEYAQQLTGFGIPTPNGYFSQPGTSLTGWNGQIADYERVGLWTVYLGEKFGVNTISQMIQDADNGVTSINNSLSTEGFAITFDEVFTNFTIANLADDISLDPNGYYGYTSFSLPIVPAISNVHSIYPVDTQQKSLSRYSAGYFQFTAEDPSALLKFSGAQGSPIVAHLVELGEVSGVNKIELNSANQGEASLGAIGSTTAFAFLVATSLNTNSNYAYSVTSEFEDLAAPNILLGPRETLPTGNSIMIYWETDEAATSIVEYGLTSEYGSVIQNVTLKDAHQILIPNLEPNTTYHYRVGSTDQRGNGPFYSTDFSFTTTSATATSITTVQQTHAYGYEGRSQVRTSNGNIHFVYHELDGDRRFVFHTASDDEGLTWSTPTRLDTSLFYGGMPSIAVDQSDRLHVSWHVQPDENDSFAIYYSRSDNQGNSWTPPKLVSKTFTTGDNLYSSVAIDPSGNPHIVWNSVVQDVNVGDTYYNRSGDGGDTWPTDQIIGSSEDHSAFVPTIDFNLAGRAFVLYSDGDFDARTRQAYFVASDDYLTWTEPEAISSSGVLYDGMLSFTIDSQNNAHAVFSDNYTPGDIRIMYTQFIASGESTGWTTPAPVVKSVVFGGQTSYPNISVDDDGQLYLLYRDSQAASGSSFGKALQLKRQDERQSLAKVNQGSGDAFLTIGQNNTWLQPTNVSSDATNTEYAELPRRSKNGIADIIWMKEFSTSNNQINFISLDTQASIVTAPPTISDFYPEDGAVEVPYFSEVLKISATFDQRVISDSLNKNNVSVTNSQGQQLGGEFVYVESQRQMMFLPSENLTPNDEITVMIQQGVKGTSGLSFDGNGNGLDDGSPVDDFVWKFNTQSVDDIAPSFTVGVLQNPVLTRYVDLYIVASEDLPEPPNLTLNSVGIQLTQLSENARLYKGDIRLESTGILDLLVQGMDYAQNAGETSKSFSVQLLAAEKDGSISSPDENLSIFLKSGSFGEDTYLTVVKIDDSEPDLLSGGMGSEAANVISAYRVGPAGVNLNRDAQLTISVQKSGSAMLLQIRSDDGSWETLPSTNNGSTVVAQISRLGSFRVLEADNLVPSDFALHQNYPNPFAASRVTTTLAFDIPFQTQVDIVIYDLLGKRVATLFSGTKNPGFHEISWDGRDEFGKRVASGIYFYQLKAAKTNFSKKMLILH